MVSNLSDSLPFTRRQILIMNDGQNQLTPIQRKKKAIELYTRTSMTQEQIAQKLGVDRTSVNKYLAKIDCTAVEKEKLNLLRKELVDQLQARLAALRIDGDYRAIMCEIKVMERMCKMLGIDAAQELNISVELPTKAEYIIDVDPQDKSS